jgi:hypothetical protein
VQLCTQCRLLDKCETPHPYVRLVISCLSISVCVQVPSYPHFLDHSPCLYESIHQRLNLYYLCETLAHSENPCSALLVCCQARPPFYSQAAPGDRPASQGPCCACVTRYLSGLRQNRYVFKTQPGDGVVRWLPVCRPSHRSRCSPIPASCRYFRGCAPTHAPVDL